MVGRIGDHELMAIALDEARMAALEDEVPVGAVIANRNGIVVRTHNRMRQTGDPTAHAEVLAIRDAIAKLRSPTDAAEASVGGVWLGDWTLVVTLEPCAMCAGAIVLARVGRLVFGAWDDKAGMCGSVGDLVRHPRLNHRPEVQGGVDGERAAQLLREFFLARRQK